ncbi:BamA/TamA family outer membrane protein [Adhaeribacter sp. BT258]|uniref:BamA/TamA family outer membrane protein n=1 Tax=Adhaeribacter terrigena TaxID=2793070 RepID=A0ABS1C2R3_9BACT|nr:BamA/TamA family outer membrane protein [Adhaeribacter terrigena]
MPTRYLKGKEKLLYDVKLEGVNQADPDKIRALFRQQPNRKVPIFGSTPYLTVYYWGKSLYNPAKVQQQIQETEEKFAKKINKAGADSSEVVKLTEKKEKKLAKLIRKKEEGNLLMRSIGEPPSIYDSTLTVETVSQINTYLSSKGFFHNRVSAQTKEEDKKIYLTLNVAENQPFRLSETAYNIKDTTVQRLVQNSQAESLIKTGQIYDEELLTQERDRLETLMRNQGFYEFRKQYIFFDVDTSFGGNTVRLKTTISNPADSANHKLYKIRTIYFIGEANVDRFGVNRDTINYGGVKYIWYKKYVSPKVLDKKIRMSVGQPYSLIRTSRTQRQIGDLDVYRFSAVNYTIVSDSLQPMLDAYVNVTPATRYQITDEIGGNFNFTNFGSSLPLPYGSFRLKVRNIFGGAENLEFGVRGGLEAQPSSVNDKLVTTTELGGNVALVFPQFLDPFFKLDSNPKLVIYNPRTRLNAAFTYTNREDYNRTNTEFSLDYLWQRSQRLQYFVSLVDINIIDATIKSDNFRKYLESRKALGVTLIESFKPGIVSSMNATMLYNSNNINQTLDAKYIKLFVEIGNLPGVITGNNTVGFSGWFSDFLSDPDPTKQQYRSYSFLKFNADYRRYYKIKEKMYFVARGNFGIVSPVPGSNNILPYDKFFFAGGGSSLRAWRPRKLGPGSYTPPYRLKDELNPNAENNLVIVNGQPQRDYRPEQPGEVLMEGNAEYRFNIFGFWNGAFFIDAGNVWNLKDSPELPGSGLKDFHKEFAVDLGFGSRFDFSFLVVRFDFATKVIDPAEPEGQRFVLDRFRLNRLLSSKNMQNSFNIGIGYPF